MGWRELCSRYEVRTIRREVRRSAVGGQQISCFSPFLHKCSRNKPKKLLLVKKVGSYDSTRFAYDLILSRITWFRLWTPFFQCRQQFASGAILIARGLNRTNHVVYLILTTLMQMSLIINKHENFQTAEIFHLKTWPTWYYIGIITVTLFPFHKRNMVWHQLELFKIIMNLSQMPMNLY